MEPRLLEVEREMAPYIPVDELRRRSGGARVRNHDWSGRVNRARAARSVRDRKPESSAEDRRDKQPKEDAEPHVNNVGIRGRDLSLVWGISAPASFVKCAVAGEFRAPR